MGAIALLALAAASAAGATTIYACASTPHFGEPAEAIDTSEWAQQLSNTGNGTDFAGAATIGLQGQLTTTEPTTLALLCLPIEGTKEATVAVFASQVSALQTTANR